MKYYIIATIDTKEIVAQGGNNLNFNDEAATNSFLESVASNNSTVPENLSIITFDSDSNEVERIKNRDDFNLVWENDSITGVDFSSEDSKNWLRTTITKTDGNLDSEAINLGDTVNVKIESLLPDKSGIDESDNNVIDAIIINPNSEIPVKIHLIDGVCNAAHQFSIPGRYSIPSGARISGYRVENPQIIDVCMEW